jgi:hypothetical protein
MSESKKPVIDSSHEAAAPAAEASSANSANVIGRIGEVAAETDEEAKNLFAAFNKNSPPTRLPDEGSLAAAAVRTSRAPSRPRPPSRHRRIAMDERTLALRETGRRKVRRETICQMR